MGRSFFPRVLVQLVRLKSGAGHHRGRRAIVQMGLEAWPQGLPLVAWEAQLARQACGRLALGYPTQQEPQGGRSWPGVLEGRARQPRVGAIAASAPVGRKRVLVTEQPPRRAATVRPLQAVWVPVPLRPTRAEAVVQQFGAGEVDHAALFP